MVTRRPSKPWELKKPDFPNGRGGYVADPDILSAELKLALSARLKAMSVAERRSFLDRTAIAMQDLTSGNPKIARDSLKAPRELQKMLQEVEGKAHDLLVALNKLSKSKAAAVCLSVHTKGLVHMEAPPAQLSPTTQAAIKDRDPERNLEESAWLALVWDMAQDLETAAWYAGTQIQPARSVRPSQTIKRSVVRVAADAFHKTTGKLPPSSKESWFPGFVEALGESIGLEKIGPDVVGAVLREMSASNQYKKVSPAPK